MRSAKSVSVEMFSVKALQSPVGIVHKDLSNRGTIAPPPPRPQVPPPKEPAEPQVAQETYEM